MTIRISNRLPATVLVCAIVTVSACGGDSQESAEAEDSATPPALASPAAEPSDEGGSGSDSEAAEAGERQEGAAGEEGREGGEHDEGSEGVEHREGGEGGEHEGEGDDEGGEGEESGAYIAREATWDATRRGARLILSYDEASDSFRGSVENTTGERICAVRVEVHLSDGPELGPTPRIDLVAGATTEVSLAADGESFEQWTAHPEVSACGGGGRTPSPLSS